MSDDPVLDLMLELYWEQGPARALLIAIGYPKAELPPFESAQQFWGDAGPKVADKVSGGRLALVERAARDNPGNARAVELFHRMKSQPPPVPVVPEQIQRVVSDPPPGSPTADPAPPPPPGTALDDRARDRTGRFPTLTLEGADLPDQFEAAARELLGDDVTLLYRSRNQSAVLIPDPGEQDEDVRRRIQERMRVDEPACRVIFQVHTFRPYAYRELIVYGPDTTAYRMDSVPATMTPEDVAAGLLAGIRDAATGREGLVRVVVDHEKADFSKRLDPYLTLHECGVRDGGRLRVAPDAIAGGILPEARIRAVLHAVRAIRRHAERDTRVVVAGCDDDVLPGSITITIDRIGLALPAGAPATGEPAPEPVTRHRVTVCFPDMFPLTAPRVVWRTPVFHPNIRSTAHVGLPAGTLQFHPLLTAWRPGFDCVHLAAMISDVAAYRDYDLADGPVTPNPAAARWAGTATGQQLITGIGGRPLADVVRQGDARTRPPGLFWIRPVGEVSHGH